MSARRKPEPSFEDDLEPGIRHAVMILRAGGVDTFESCEGGRGHAFSLPTIRFNGGTWAGYRAFAVAMEHGLPVRHLRYAFSAINGHLEAPCWELVFDEHVRLIGADAAASAHTPRGSRRRAPLRAANT